MQCKLIFIFNSTQSNNRYRYEQLSLVVFLWHTFGWWRKCILENTKVGCQLNWLIRCQDFIFKL